MSQSNRKQYLQVDKKPNPRKAVKATNKSDKCTTKWCRNKRAKNRAGRSYFKCWKCRSRAFKQRNPATYFLNGLRRRARRRQIPCTLTIEEFKKWCADTNFLPNHGTTSGTLTVDRKDRTKGYHIWNIQPMLHEDNSAQGKDNTPRVECMSDNQEPPAENEPF